MKTNEIVFVLDTAGLAAVLAGIQELMSNEDIGSFHIVRNVDTITFINTDHSEEDAEVYEQDLDKVE